MRTRRFATATCPVVAIRAALKEPQYVYDFVDESPLQPASNLSSRLGASIFFKREDLLPSFSYRIRGVYNLLGELKREGVTSVVSYSVGGQGHSLAVAARSPVRPISSNRK